MKIYTLLALGAAMTLGAAAVWMGGLNQDEGWYLYAANLVANGKVLYRDFFYTQGPVLPLVYSFFTGVWKSWGLLGARLFTLALGFIGIWFAVGLVRRLAPRERRNEASLIVFLLLSSNIYHLYYLAIPKTYALAGLFVIVGFYLLSFAEGRSKLLMPLAGLSLAFAAGTRISLGVLLPVVGVLLLVRRNRVRFLLFCLGGFFGLALVYGPSLLDPVAREGLWAAQAYHAARGGFDIVWTVGSFSRLVRWYLPIIVLLGLEIAWCRRVSFAVVALLVSFLAVFVLQMLAPFPYEDYQVPIMALLAVAATVMLVEQPLPSALFGTRLQIPLVLFLCCATSFGSPLLETWSVNGQDRFWSLKKDKTELAQLRDVAQTIESLDPGGKTLLTQDLYLAIETRRHVPEGLEMGPFAIKTDAEWRTFLKTVDCPVAALSGYTFAIEPPSCAQRPIGQQMDYWNILKSRYTFVGREENFGQNHTSLLILKRTPNEK